MENGVSEIDDARFFLAPDGKTDAKRELHATIDALLNETTFDDSSTACRFPARKAWLKEQLNNIEFPQVTCGEYDKILERLNPKSATLVFPSAHINSPASMFGHTFLRINSAYNSKLLSYAVNYAADADPSKENGALFAIKGLFGGYFGKYSLLPYYDKLKEYRDAEQRDIWEYDLNLSEEEVLKMVRHIWEINETHSYYYFFTQNCSYNMLWFLEAARPELDLRSYFYFQVIPLETVHATKAEGVIKEHFYRPSKRTTLLEYEKLIHKEHRELPLKLAASDMDAAFLDASKMLPEQKRYILEASIELLEYDYSKSKIDKETYLKRFHTLSKARAALGIGEKITIQTPPNPIESHQAIRASFGTGVREGKSIGFMGLRPAYHSLEDSGYGFLRGTQIEFLSLELSNHDDKFSIEDATILSIVSIAQRSDFFDNLSWRTKFGWDRNSLDNSAHFIGTVGAGFSWGNEFGYTYIMTDPLFYHESRFQSAIGGSVGFVLDKWSLANTKIELTKRLYDTGETQNIFEFSQGFRVSQNLQLRFDYDYKERGKEELEKIERNLRAYLNIYF